MIKGCKRLPLDQVLANGGQDSFANEDEENDILDRAFREVVLDLEDDLSQQDVASELEDIDDDDLSDFGPISDNSESIEEEESHISYS
ncbi:hypothetical protein SAMD00023353_1301940 [Rosellinia necatrix]|uniref:Uncharacterized protein n=1 Tax=Rosellinia necatrix TaxID=77044 RepID=A0A1S8A721_ROSNE|nr:hypothetical protein SAMD00023353_1301940 [Rosellinia necatrix]